MAVRRLALALLLGQLMWIEPATAQKTYSLTVSIHEQARPKVTDTDVRKILAAASKLLTQTDRCGVTFKLKGSVGTFSDAPNVIKDESDLEAVHREKTDVKIVQDIQFCKTSGSFVGCSWRRDGPKTMIVTQKVPNAAHIIWAHEFGHTTGLQHRTGMNALMTPCDLFLNTVEISRDECNCFLGGPASCSIPETNLTCPAN